jgi:hypothetical protein
LAEYSPLSHSHELLPVSVSDSSLPVDYVLSAIADGSLEPALDTGDDPLWKEVLASSEREYWIAGARKEIKSLKDLQVFVLVPRSSVPLGQQPMRGKLVCKCKRDDSGQVVRYKVRYIAKGYAQRHSVNYDKTTAPTTCLESFRLILHLAASLGWDIHQFDIKTAFLHGVLPPEEINYMEQPLGFEEPGKKGWVMQLIKSIYGMKQASHIWNKTFHDTVCSWGFHRMKKDWCVYRCVSDTRTTVFALHVNDIIATSSSEEETKQFKADLKSCWEISNLGPAKFALGIAITCNPLTKTISISQSTFIDRLLEKFKQTNAHPCDTPMITSLQLIQPNKLIPTPPDVVNWMQRTPYHELVDSLNYLAVTIHPDIAFAVGRLAAFLNCYRSEHWQAAIHVLRYVKGTRLLSLVLGGDASLSLSGYSDFDYANCVDTSRSISGYFFSLGTGVILWSSKKQKHAAVSSCYAEYIALHHSGKELIFLSELLEELGHPPSFSVRLHCDNNAARFLAEDQSHHANVKHFRVRYHSIRDLIKEGLAHVARVHSSHNVADIFMKALAHVDFECFCQMLGLCLA